MADSSLGFLSYLKRNTHLQEVLDVIAPPIGGPATDDRAKIMARTPPIGPLSFPGISVATPMESE